ncbi:epoxide hydrolase 1 [Mastacembelus armatus]|uniref:Epoxide hydrolase n=1 Tax=Mastacembelus armatus TaxID=205130 RepID=A0A7N8YCX1_9TELE|nr:epoxide hydrolase 1 [Mastacembelus armatus]XP_026175142.1 epoxide hydrolase 1 [Mastacembelus armatus]XP_026175143.1 epoxide hydrolase 1 [Mastacembelus armatus]XP_026175144.1 epoxide hydrolase 1 [Mastacembelus armatus]XP_026175145.1 epoxide hydrolase 1 [Mastacembelus armatus]XP_026175146.1 epoxide hydrolase 1 [Mastacembelus armatus]XP_026175147.1 epoxide hydrolase 1 [Mastacembelus armatus]
MFTEVLVGLVIGGLIFFLAQRSKKQVLKTEDGWWGIGIPPDGEEDATIRPFKVTTSEEELEDLYRRIDQTRPVTSLEDSQFHYGFNSQCLQKVVSYWRNDFNWRRQVDKLNQYPHFKTKIEGIDIHYLHVKPKNVPEGTTAIPIIMVHGWPGSFYEFYGLIPLLTEPSAPDHLVFEVVCPSIPGYGYSEAPHKKGFNSVCAARVFHKLMKRLGFHQFYAHGGDWGWLITTNMAQLDPKSVKGLHVNFAPPSKPSLPIVLSVILGRYFPKLFGFSDMDVEHLFPCMEKLVVESFKESGYMHIQATKPDTVGRGLNDSPVGLAAYILEKFSTWTCHDFRNLEDGGLTRKFSLDDLLTNVMIYWTSGCIVSSMRFYKENLGKGLNQPHSKLPVYIPTGFACFPNELMYTPKLWVKQKYRKLLTFTPMARGGHFAAMEEPQSMAEDIQKFTKIVEKKKKQ